MRCDSSTRGAGTFQVMFHDFYMKRPGRAFVTVSPFLKSSRAMKVQGDAAHCSGSKKKSCLVCKRRPISLSPVDETTVPSRKYIHLKTALKISPPPFPAPPSLGPTRRPLIALPVCSPTCPLSIYSHRGYGGVDGPENVFV